MSNIIYTIKTAELDTETWWTVTLPTIEAYALRVGAELKVITEAVSTDIPNPYFLKFECFRDFITTAHDRMLYVDLDVYINDDAPNIFDVLPSGFHISNGQYQSKEGESYCVWMRDKGVLSQAHLMKNAGVILADRSDVISINNITPSDLTEFYNSNKIINGTDLGLNAVSETEQPYLCLFLFRSGIVINNLPRIWHGSHLFKEEHNFVHYTGKAKRFLA